MQISLIQFFDSISSIDFSTKGDILFITSNDEDAQNYAAQLSFFVNSREVLYLPSLDSLPYDRVSPSQKIISSRAYVLSKLASKMKLETPENNIILVTPARNLLHKFELRQKIEDKFWEIHTGARIKINDLEKNLISSGYTRSAVAFDSGDYSIRGDILDFVNFKGEGYRINFEWDKIGKIKLFDPETQISSKLVDNTTIFMSSEVILTSTAIENFRKNYLVNFGISKTNEDFFEKICAGVKVSGIENIAPVFYSDTGGILSYLNSPKIFSTDLAHRALSAYRNEIDESYAARSSSKSFYPAFKPDSLYYSVDEASRALNNTTLVNYQDDGCESNKYTPNFYYNSTFEAANKTSLQLFLDFISSHKNKKIIVFCSLQSSRERLKILFEQNDVAFKDILSFHDAKDFIINLALIPIDKGFITSTFIAVSDTEIMGLKKYSPQASNKKLKNIFKELENFAQNDLIVHKEHGIGRYEGIEQIDVENIRHDCLKIVYSKGDKLFIRVENIDLIKKYGDGEVELDSLGSSAWQRRKSKLKERIGDLAKTLIDLAAKRKLTKISSIEYDAEAYNSFCNKFPYAETEDQLRACFDVLTDLSGDMAMDRLICGDVGFGKTEVAMRTAFLVGCKKQVAVIVPTTILAQQHYNNFKERFLGFNIKIGHLSRFVNKKDVDSIKAQITDGTIDIIIGTHALLSENIKFHNLGLIVIDEEQHFGVSQKEKLKKIRESVHSLTLSATPIPRTLQMSLLGVKDLSLIATAPVDRLSVKTNLIEFDEMIIRDALLKEKFRGGKSFFVCPRVADLNEISDRLKNLVPELSVRMAHGQLSINQIDKIMSDFYDGKFDVLLSTAIVESGLDVPSANTMIIYKAEMFGLSQLYQLRGRVGRGKIKRICVYDYKSQKNTYKISY